MHLPTALLLLFACAPTAAQDLGEVDPVAREHAFVEVTVEPEVVYVGQPFSLRVSIGIEKGFLEDRIVPLFQQELDVPVQLHANWWQQLDGAELALEEERARGATLALDDDVGRAERTGELERDGATFTTFALERRFVARGAGTIDVPRTLLRFAYARSSGEDFLGRRTLEDPRGATLTASELELEVLALPREGRRPDFGGAVGRVVAYATVEPRELELGDHVRLTLELECATAGSTFSPPALTELEGFLVVGRLEESPRGRVRTIVYDLKPTGVEIRGVPAIEVPYFDPGPPATYAVATTEPLPLLVRPARTPAPQPPAAEREEALPDTPEAEGGSPSALVLIAIALALGLALGIVLIARRPGTVAARGALDASRQRGTRRDTAPILARLANGADDPLDALRDLLAAHLDCEPAEVPGRALAERLRARGVDPTLAGRTARLRDALEAARYADGSPPTEDPAELARELDRALAP